MKKILLLATMALSAIMASAQPKLFVQPNEPLGEGKGVHPGRVVWVHSPGVASWDGETGLWVEDRWNDQHYCDEYLREAATIPHPVTGVVYDPERDGKPLTAPLGLMEHADKERPTRSST